MKKKKKTSIYHGFNLSENDVHSKCTVGRHISLHILLEREANAIGRTVVSQDSYDVMELAFSAKEKYMISYKLYYLPYFEI
jgi:hypothetical protein